MTQLFANNAETTLQFPIDTAADTMTVTDASLFPALGPDGELYLTLVEEGVNALEVDWEIVRVTAIAGNVLSIYRAQEDTVARPWPFGSKVSLRLTAGSLDRLRQFENIQNKPTTLIGYGITDAEPLGAASTSATAAASSAAAASISATSAAASQTDAADLANAAASSASAANTSANAAAGYATNSSNSATQASTYATNAQTSANAASISASAAATSATNAATSATNAANALVASVKYTEAQSLTTNQQLRARTNINAQVSLGFVPENSANKGVANGYASLGPDGKVPAIQLPSFVDYVQSEIALNKTRSALDAIDNAGSVIILGDSITNGANATSYDKCFSYRLTRSIFNRIAGVSADDQGYGYETLINMQSAVLLSGIAHNGTIVTGSGATGYRLRLNSGQYISLTGREIKQFDVFYDGSVSSGALVFTLNGTTFATKALSGTGTKTTFPTAPFINGTISPEDTVTISASGGTVYITGLISLRGSQISPYVTVVGRGSWGFDEFADSTRAAEVAAQVNVFRSSAPKTLFIFLGTNNIYNPTIQKNPADYITALSSLIAEYKSRMSGVTVVLSVPLQANESTFPLMAGTSYDDYVDAIVNFADANKYQVVRFDRTGIDTSFYSDGVHPNNAGHSVMAAKVCETIGIPYAIGSFRSAQSVDPYREANITFNDTWRNFGGLSSCQVKSHKIGRIIHLSGIAESNGSSSTTIGTLPVGMRPIGADVFAVANGNSSPVHIKIAQTGVITVSAAVTFVSLQNISFIVKPVQ